jgi:pyridoxal phosphate enzyme (YggS family)
MGIAENYAWVREHVAQAARRVGRDPQEVRIVAVSKTVGLPEVQRALDVGIHDFGENRPDQLVAKTAAFPEATWHFIGNIQSRRIKDIVGRAALIHSVDRLDLVPRLQRRAEEQDVVAELLLEVNVSGEESKSGFEPGAVAQALETLQGCDHLQVRGLMTMAPQGQPDMIRRSFSGLRELRDQLRPLFGGNIDLSELSMGMSEDFEAGVEEGATIVRVGRSIFDEDFVQEHETC